MRRFTQSQASVPRGDLRSPPLVARLLLLVRFGKLRDGRTVWLQIWPWICQSDTCFATRHWLVTIILLIDFSAPETSMKKHGRGCAKGMKKWGSGAKL
ncbi:hypothetical protein RHGRI_016975 [Rhododendron griersonianum]|uniref:Uncharacterized protein n=1 Tax=Rhododendron griersonianum TaxID=479676 RepID=A0AAV6JW92_9ERIC|nr:hypothetical protein RHGRI_026665 [Rhododendron griersonianum]KAG5544397.1 hypothetical protein RHGRI_016975 [Rhododendron griersonianum]